MLENYNLVCAIAITPAGASAYTCMYVPNGSIRLAFTYILLVREPGTNFHSAVCVSGDAAMAFGYQHFFRCHATGLFSGRKILCVQTQTTDSRSYFAAIKFVNLTNVYLSLTFLLSNRIPLCFPIEQEA